MVGSGRAPLVGVVAALAMLAGVAAADVVTLADGSRLIGKIHGMMDGRLTLETQFAGTIEIDAELVQEIHVDEPVNVGMDTGDRLVGSIEWRPELNVAVVQTQLGGIPVEVAHVQAIWPVGGKSPEMLQIEKEREEFEARLEKLRPKWTFTAEVGLTKKNGNTESLEARGGLELKRKTEREELRFYLTGNYAEQDDVRDESEVILGAYYETLIDTRWFAYARSELEYDEFENLELRAHAAGGLGYYWIKEEWHELKNRVGLGIRHESYLDDTPSDTFGQLDLGVDYRLDILEWLRFTYSLTYTPGFDSIGNYRLDSDGAFLIPLAKNDQWKLKFGIRNEYDSRPAPGVKRLDTTYYANIQFNLELQ